MHDVIVSNLDDETYEALKKQAAAEGRPLEDWLRHKLQREALQAGSQSTPDRVRRRVEEAAGIRAMQPRRIDLDSTTLIRIDRDSR